MPIDDYCKFFRDIEANPEALITGLTIRDYLYLREHLFNCDSCFNITERVNAKNKNQNTIGFGTN